MIGREELINFKRMWIWLCAYPSHDRRYFMENVLKLEEMWTNSCPLSDISSEKSCEGCQIIWKSNKGTLCTDPESPLYQWINTEEKQPENRSVYASQVAVLTMNFLRDNMDHRDMQIVHRKSPNRYIGSSNICDRIILNTVLNKENLL